MCVFQIYEVDKLRVMRNKWSRKTCFRSDIFSRSKFVYEAFKGFSICSMRVSVFIFNFNSVCFLIYFSTQSRKFQRCWQFIRWNKRRIIFAFWSDSVEKLFSLRCLRPQILFLIVLSRSFPINIVFVSKVLKKNWLQQKVRNFKEIMILD